MKRTPRRLVIGVGWVLAIVGVTQGSLFGQSESMVELPLFRPRTDPMATRDADAVRERLKSLSDSRGPINPLADYVKPKESIEQKASSDNSRVVQDDEESRRIPSLDPEAQRRLKAQPPSVAASERHIIGLLPPPMIPSNPGPVVTSIWQDDGFRPLSSVAPASAPVVIGPAPIVVQSNYQVGDPAAMIPPSLGPPSTGLPTYSAPPSGLPLINAPAMSAPAMNAPTMGVPAMGVPMSGAPPIGAPATISPPSGGLGGIPGSVPMVGAPGSNVMPAPPSYIVPGPSNTFVPATVPSAPYAAPIPYAAPTPTYSRSGGTVNSLPFVSSPPQARDARWMVSPDVYRRMEGGVCTTPPPSAYGAPMAGTGTGSPFFYAPPTAMPMPTPRTASRHSWLHPFRR